jgi:hypothetical protein
MTGRAVMVRWIQVGHDDLLHRSEGMSGVSNLTCTPSQHTCQARNSLVFGMCYRPPDGGRSQAEITGI